MYWLWSQPISDKQVAASFWKKPAVFLWKCSCVDHLITQLDSNSGYLEFSFVKSVEKLIIDHYHTTALEINNK